MEIFLEKDYREITVYYSSIVVAIFTFPAKGANIKYPIYCNFTILI